MQTFTGSVSPSRQTRLQPWQAVLASLALALILATLATRSLAAAETSECYIRDSAEAVECTQFEFPLDWESPEGSQISVRAVRVPSRSMTAKPDAVFVLAGGPGQAASDFFRLVETTFADLRADRDIILMDQRGTGASSPMSCQPTSRGLYTALDEIERWAADCYASADFDASYLTSAEIVEDMEAIRRHYGYSQLNLWGGSFGTRLAQHYYRAYPDHVRSVVIDAVLATEDVLFESAPLGAQRAFDSINARCSGDAACQQAFADIGEKLAGVLDGLEQVEDVSVPDPYSGEIYSERVDAAAVAQTIRTALYAGNSTAWVPYIVNALDRGNYAPLLAASANGSDWASKTMYLGSTLAILCGEEVPRVDPTVVAAAAANSFTRDSYYRFWQSACAGWQARPLTPRLAEPVAFTVPALMISGEFDPVTPPSNVENLMARSTKAFHLLVPGGGHTNSTMSCVPDVINAFILSADVTALDGVCQIDSVAQPLMLGAAGPVGQGGVQ